MNLYFLVEGVTEIILYRTWLKYLLPNFQLVRFHDQATQNCYYIIGDYGFPGILDDGIHKALDNIQSSQKYDYLILCVDADEESVQERQDYIYQFLEKEKIDLASIPLKIFVQNRCIETWLLGNRKLFDSRQPLEKPLIDYANYYDVSRYDPELLGKYNQDYYAEFHEIYLKAIFNAKGLKYTKTMPRDAQEKHYFEQLLKRIDQEPEHLQTFRAFISFCENLK